MQIFSWTLFGIIAILQVMDGMTTVVGLRRTGNVEVGILGNGVMARIFAAIGVLPGLIIVKGCMLIVLAAIQVYFPSEIYTIALAIIAALYAAVVANNYRRL